jgi:pyruvate carboxylase subunit B
MVDGERSWTVLRGGEITEVAVEDERARQLRGVGGGGERKLRGGVVVAPMPGLVLRVEVQQGQTIGPGTGVAVLEAMKMENQISAVSGGVVTKVHVKAGQAVEKGALLVEVLPQG